MADGWLTYVAINSKNSGLKSEQGQTGKRISFVNLQYPYIIKCIELWQLKNFIRNVVSKKPSPSNNLDTKQDEPSLTSHSNSLKREDYVDVHNVRTNTTTTNLHNFLFY